MASYNEEKIVSDEDRQWLQVKLTAKDYFDTIDILEETILKVALSNTISNKEESIEHLIESVSLVLGAMAVKIIENN